jgi:hypothetical protein
VLNANSHSDFASWTIQTGILRTCKQIHKEAEEVLYGNPQTVWDCGLHIEALMAFLGDRSPFARSQIKHIKIAREIPDLINGQIDSKEDVWKQFEAFLVAEMMGLRNLDLVVWSRDGSTSQLPIMGNPGEELEHDRDIERRRLLETENKWREWAWTKGVLDLEGLCVAKITWWGFDTGEEKRFDPQIAGLMVRDQVMRKRMVRDGGVIEGVVVLRGSRSWEAVNVI